MMLNDQGWSVYTMGQGVGADLGRQSDRGERDFFFGAPNPRGALFPAGQTELTAQRTILDDATLAGLTQLVGELFG